jgi:hypothetical protein
VPDLQIEWPNGDTVTVKDERAAQQMDFSSPVGRLTTITVADFSKEVQHALKAIGVIVDAAKSSSVPWQSGEIEFALEVGGDVDAKFISLSGTGSILLRLKFDH